MELQTTSTGEQLSQLHDVLNSERAKFMKLMMEREITQNTENEKDDHGESAVDELARLKKMLSTADSEVILTIRLNSVS